MTNPLSELLHKLFPSLRRAAHLAELERAVDETAAALEDRAARRRDRNDQDRANMLLRDVQDVCQPG